MLANVNLAGYEVPTPIQKCTLPAILRGHDVIGIAQTGDFVLLVCLFRLLIIK